MLDIKEHIPLAPLTTFEIGGDAKYFVKVRSESQIREALAWARSKGVSFVILAGGSNVLVPDKGLEALVIQLRGNLWGMSENTVDVWAGTNLLELIRSLGVQGFGGWENLAGIPGTIGGAARGNAGAFGSEIKDFIVKVRALNTNTLEVREFANADCDFSYRHSFFKNNPQWIILRVFVELQNIDAEKSLRAVEATITEREKRHLQNIRAAGSFFMNPVALKEVQELFEKEKQVKSREGRVPAGWLIEKAGMKGAEVGGAQASLQHPNYIVNRADATAKNVLDLRTKIKQKVLETFGIELREEAVILE